MGMKHAYKSLKADPADSTIIGATKWNDDHYFLDSSGVAIGAVGDLSYRGASGLVTLLSGAQGILYSAGSGNVPAWSMTPTLTGLTVTTITVGAVVIDATDAGKIDGITNGTTAASKALVTDANGAMSILRTASLRLGTSGAETTVTATGAEINTLAGVTAGTATASKALVVDANKDLATLRNLTISGNLVTGSTTLSETDLAKIDAITNGTVAASKALVVDASKDLSGLNNLVLTGSLSIANGVGTEIVFTGTDSTNISSAGSLVFLSNLVGGNISWGANATGSIMRLTSAGLIFPTDNTYDIGASVATRARNLFLAGGITHGSATLLTTTTSLTNGAGALTGTLTNSPATGNPTKWIPINDNGTTRYIPAW